MKLLKKQRMKNISENEMDKNANDKWRQEKIWRENIMLNGNGIVQFYITAVGSDNDSM